jgi:hypothetical protein
MLTVGVEHEERLGRRSPREQVLPADGDCVSFPEVGRKAKETDAGLGGDAGEFGGSLGRHAVVNEQDVAEVCSHFGYER